MFTALHGVTADRHQAKRPGKHRIVWHYKINVLLLEYALFVCIWSRRLKLYWRKRSLIQMLKKHLVYNLTWSCFMHTVACTNITMPCCVTAVPVIVKLSRNQSWANLLFSVLWDSILDSILHNLFNESWTKSRIETLKGLSTFFWTVLYTHVHLNEEMLLVKCLLE